jgi:hypothetical protein
VKHVVKDQFNGLSRECKRTWRKGGSLRWHIDDRFDR